MKKVLKKAKEEEIKPISQTCPECLGSGLWRSDYVNSPQCTVCKGEGKIV